MKSMTINETATTDKKTAEERSRARPLANLFEIYMSKRERNGRRQFFSEADKQTAVFLANSRRR